jgi:hypothetical protein
VRRSTAATVAAAASVDDLRNSPLGTVLAQYKEAQAAWAQEKVCTQLCTSIAARVSDTAVPPFSGVVQVKCMVYPRT